MDLKAFFDGVVDSLAPVGGEPFPGFPVSKTTSGNGQTTKGKGISRISRISRTSSRQNLSQTSNAVQAGASVRAGAGAREFLLEAREMREQREMPAGPNAWLSRSLSQKREKEKETGNPQALRGDPHRAHSAAPQDYDERAAFLEYECGLSRADAEAQAAAESAAIPPASEVPSEAGAGLTAWRAGLALLSPRSAPCPDYRNDEWPRVYAKMVAFLDEFGLEAEALGWTTPRLFGVHHQLGTIRVDSCGGLVLGVGGAVSAITATEIRLGHLTHRSHPWQPAGVPIWEFGR